jgi:hypothetical protein
MEAAKALGGGAFAKQLFLAGLHDRAARLRAGSLLGVAVHIVCERRGNKTGDEKYKRDHYQ